MPGAGPTTVGETEVARRLGREWLSVTGVADGFDERIHESDEMYHTARLAERLPDSARLQYYRDGREVVESVRNLLDATGRSFRQCARVLEMACGYGRVTRHLVREISPDCITAADVVGPAVGFVGEVFGVDARASSTDPAELDVGDDFDLVIASSFFAHLPRASFGAWLEALSRTLTPRGMLVFSTHGPGVLAEHPKDPGGFTFLEGDGPDGAALGTAFVTPELVDAIAREHGLGHVVSMERELWMLQDVHVASRQPVRGIERWRHATFVQGVVDRMVAAGGTYEASGWAADTRPELPMSDVRILLDGREIDRVPVDGRRIDVARALGRPDWLQSGWSVEGRLPELGPGEHLLTAQGVSESGATNVLGIVPVVA